MPVFFTRESIRRQFAASVDFPANWYASLAQAVVRASTAGRRHTPLTPGPGPQPLVWIISGLALVGTFARGVGKARLVGLWVGVRAVPLGRLWTDVLALLVLASKGVRRHARSALCTAVLLSLSASLAGASVPLALLLWVLASLVMLAIWRALEPFVLRRLGCRSPGHLECERFDQALGPVHMEVAVVDAPQPWLLNGLRTVVVSRALLDLLEDRALAGLLTDATICVRAASLPGEVVVWLGNLPVLGGVFLSRGVMRVGLLLATVIGTSLVVPLVLWPDGFIRWAGRVFGVVLVGLLGSALLSSGLSAAGLDLLLAWVVVAGLRTLLNWETARAEVAADDVTFAAGRGWELLEALETLTWADSVPPPSGLLGWLDRAASPLTERADRLWRKLVQI